MRRLVCGWTVALVIGLGVGTASAQYPGWRERSFDGFDFDPEVTRGVWAEGMGGYRQTDSSDVFSAAARLAYGHKLGELGVTVPWYSTEGSGNEADGLGDVTFYGKVVPLQTQYVNAGGGLRLLAPTGNSHDGLGDGALGFEPFLSASLNLERFQLRGNVAWLTTTDNSASADGVRYGFGLFAAANEYFGARFEFTGANFDQHGPATLEFEPGSDPLSFRPGIDIRFLFPEVDMYFRPTGIIGLNNDAYDWGVIGSLVISRSPDWLRR